jgi:hypothetical protein
MAKNANAPKGIGARREGNLNRSHATATRPPVATDCRCQACADLLAACGAALFPMYAKKLLIVGWSGVKSPVETAYCLAHRSEAQQAAAIAAGARMKTMREGAHTPSTDGGTGGSGGSAGMAARPTLTARIAAGPRGAA